MASAVDIVNLALARLGDSAEVTAISPPDGSAQAAQAARFYPIARDALLEMHDWAFATRRAVGSELDVTVDGWEYVYQLPNECLKVLNVWQSGQSDEAEGWDFLVESDSDQGTVIYTNCPEATFRFIVRVSDTTKFTPIFTTALSFILASYLAGPILKGETGMQVSQSMFKLFMSEFAKAAASDAANRKFKPKHNPEFLAARGAVNPYLADGRIIR